MYSRKEGLWRRDVGLYCQHFVVQHKQQHKKEMQTCSHFVTTDVISGLTVEWLESNKEEGFGLNEMHFYKHKLEKDAEREGENVCVCRGQTDPEEISRAFTLNKPPTVYILEPRLFFCVCI